MSSNQQSKSRLTLKNWVAATLLASLFHAAMVNAVGLGRLNVTSRLGQPFAAEIDLINVARDDLATLNVSLAPRAAYQAANLSFDPALNALRLSVERRANGTPYIRATSARRVTEPYLDLLVEITSRDGKLQRAYAALLDLPDTAKPAAAAPKPVAATPVPKAGVVRPRAPRPSRAPKEPVAQDSTPAANPALAVTAAAPVVPATPTPVTPAAPGNPALAQLESKPVEPATPALPKSEPAAAEALKAQLPKPEPKEAASVPAPAPPATTLKKDLVPPPPPPPPPPPRGIIDRAMNHIVLIGGVALALLAGIGGLWALRRRKQAREPLAPTVDTDAFKVGTTAVAAAAASVTPSSASAAGATAPNVFIPPEATVANVTDIVDPIDEAKVYLEYGQNEPAEKVLRKALSEQPGREDMQMLLLEILAARGDKDGFNQLAGRLHKQTGGLGEHWKRAMTMGYVLDPASALYSPTDIVAAHAAHSPAAASAEIDPGSLAPAPDKLINSADILLDDKHASRELEDTMVRAHAGVELTAAEADLLPSLNFELPPATEPVAGDHSEKAAVAPVAEVDPGLEFNVDFSSINPKPVDEPPSSTAAAAVASVDFSSINPKLEDESSAIKTEATDASEPPNNEMQQKIVLARAYAEMGDKEGALELLLDVEREGDAGQRSEARTILQTLG